VPPDGKGGDSHTSDNDANDPGGNLGAAPRPLHDSNVSQGRNERRVVAGLVWGQYAWGQQLLPSATAISTQDATGDPPSQSAHMDPSSGGCCHAHCTMSLKNCAKDMLEGLARQLLALIIARQHQILCSAVVLF
jgi:hypothetical protein